MNIPFPRASMMAVPAGGPPAGVTAMTAANEPEYGLYAMLAGLLILAGLDSAALAAFSGNINGAVAVIGTISAPVVAMVSAYFGMKVGAQSGSASAAAAGKARQQAETEVKSLLGHMAPDQAVPVMRTLGIPVAGDAPQAAA
jgi:hypothetical protein